MLSILKEEPKVDPFVGVAVAPFAGVAGDIDEFLTTSLPLTPLSEEVASDLFSGDLPYFARI